MYLPYRAGLAKHKPVASLCILPWLRLLVLCILINLVLKMFYNNLVAGCTVSY